MSLRDCGDITSFVVSRCDEVVLEEYVDGDAIDAAQHALVHEDGCRDAARDRDRARARRRSRARIERAEW